jgi:hypothetical protein
VWAIVFAALLTVVGWAGPAVGNGGQAVAAATRLPILGPARVVYDGDMGDPFVLPVTAAGYVVRFVIFGTANHSARIPTAHSSDLTTWQQGPDALPLLPLWAAPDPQRSFSWAPAVLQTPVGYVMYVSLPEARSLRQCIGVAVSLLPDGPYLDLGLGPLLCRPDLGGSIDPSVVRDRAGNLHLLWKNDGNSIGAPVSLWEQRLRADGFELLGEPHRLLTAQRSWQAGIIEEPAAVPAADGGWWLFYSGNLFDTPRYAIGVAYCPSLEGPCHDRSERPFLDTAGLHQSRQFAPGGLESFRDSHGVLQAVFDTWNSPARNGYFHCCRVVQMAPLLSQ